MDKNKNKKKINATLLLLIVTVISTRLWSSKPVTQHHFKI